MNHVFLMTFSTCYYNMYFIEDLVILTCDPYFSHSTFWSNRKKVENCQLDLEYLCCPNFA